MRKQERMDRLRDLIDEGLTRAEATQLFNEPKKYRPLETAPRDGTVIRARGYNYGDPLRGKHYVRAVYHNGQWRNALIEDEELVYIVEWRPL